MDPSGELHIFQAINDDGVVYQEWQWDGQFWRSLDSRRLYLENQSTPLSIQTGTGRSVFTMH